MNKLILATLATAFTANVAIAQSVAEANGILTCAPQKCRTPHSSVRFGITHYAPAGAVASEYS